jgi:uncharacterized protein (DUF2236 family)
VNLLAIGTFLLRDQRECEILPRTRAYGSASRDTRMRFVREQSGSPRLDHQQSVAKLINAERIVVLGWGRAILMQLAHPLVAAGVDQHSTFRTHPLAPIRRLHDTIGAMLALTFGTREEVARAAGGINRIHDRVHGTLQEDTGRYRAGTRYSAHDPELLAWVELTLLESLPLAYETFVAPLSDRDRDAWCRDACANVGLLGVPLGRIPDSYDAVRRVVRERLESGELAVGATARRLARSMLYPPFAPFAWPTWRLHQLAAIGLLAPELRDEYGLPWTPADQRLLDRSARACRAIVPRLPKAARHWRPARRTIAGV